MAQAQAQAQAVVERWLKAIEARDVEGIAGLLADDVTIHSEGLNIPVIGKQTVRGFLDPVIGVYESLEIRPEQIVASDGAAAVLARVRARLRGDLALDGETLPTAGKRLELVVALFVTVNDAGRISRVSRVQDLLGIARQLGMPVERFLSFLETLERRLQGSRPPVGAERPAARP